MPVERRQWPHSGSQRRFCGLLVTVGIPLFLSGRFLIDLKERVFNILVSVLVPDQIPPAKRPHGIDDVVRHEIMFVVGFALPFRCSDRTPCAADTGTNDRLA